MEGEQSPLKKEKMVVATDEKSEFVEECNVNQAVEALYKVLVATKEKKSKKQLFDEEIQGKVVLTITLKKIPVQQHVKILNILLPNPVCFPETTRICFFVKDLVRRQSDHDETKAHYKELLQNKGINFISEIIPVHQLRREYHEYELKRHLCNSYDLYLMDRRILRYIPELLGRSIYRRKRFPISVRMEGDFLKDDIRTALSSTSLYVHGYGTSLAVHVGFTTFTEKQIKENVMAVIDGMGNKLPGGWENVRSIYIKTLVSMAIPIYVSEDSSNDIVLPTEKKRPMLPVVDEHPTTGMTIEVYPNGAVKTFGKKKYIRDFPDDKETKNDNKRSIRKRKTRSKKRKLEMSKTIDTEEESEKDDESVNEEPLIEKKEVTKKIRVDKDSKKKKRI